MQISVVIPTCDRRARLLSLLRDLDRSAYPLNEVIIVDAGDDKLSPAEYSRFSNLDIQYVSSERSVCIQRNTGIRMARSPWIFLCDDDIEIAGDYLQGLVNHIHSFPETGAVSGLWLEKVNGEWKASHPVVSTGALVWKYIFGLGIWGEIDCAGNSIIIKKIRAYYKRKGNHISKAGWPVNTNFAGDYIVCPVYSLGASLVKKEWLIRSPYDEVLDRQGIGDNYGVIMGFPVPAIQVVNKVVVYHHHEQTNRLKESLQYYRRVLALAYFIRIRQALPHVKKHRLIWSLAGNFFRFLLAGDFIMIKATLRSIWQITFDTNPYRIAKQEGRKVAEPVL
ncbi:MAG: glycosyltransferase [Chitinophagaceae bacterium]|nr:glycosyltransferase [Chitinophagaceae bacterium]